MACKVEETGLWNPEIVSVNRSRGTAAFNYTLDGVVTVFESDLSTVSYRWQPHCCSLVPTFTKASLGTCLDRKYVFFSGGSTTRNLFDDLVTFLQPSVFKRRWNADMHTVNASTPHTTTEITFSSLGGLVLGNSKVDNGVSQKLHESLLEKLTPPRGQPHVWVLNFGLWDPTQQGYRMMLPHAVTAFGAVLRLVLEHLNVTFPGTTFIWRGSYSNRNHIDAFDREALGLVRKYLPRAIVVDGYTIMRSRPAYLNLDGTHYQGWGSSMVSHIIWSLYCNAEHQ